MTRLLLVPSILLALLLIGSQPPPPSTAAGWVEINTPEVVCSGPTTAVRFTWASPRLSTEHWVELSLEDNGFAPDTFLSAGPLGPLSGEYVWAGLQPNLVHYWRVVALAPEGWIASDTGSFRSCDPPAPKPSLESSPFFAETREMETDLFRRHNDIRVMANLNSLELDDMLTKVARQRAADMADEHYFSHFSPLNQTAFGLLYEAGYVYTHGAENIAENDYPIVRAVGAVMRGFLDSPPHAATIIDPRFTHIGVGIAHTPDDWNFFVVVFAQR